VLHLSIPLTGDLGLALRLVALVSTYVAHGLLWAASVALLTRGGRMPASVNSWMWRMALFGPLLTTVLSATLVPALDPQGTCLSLVSSAGTRDAFSPGLPGVISTPEEGEAAGAYWLSEDFWRWLVLAGSAALLLGLARFAHSAALVFRRIRGSQPSADERSKRLLAALLSQTRLTRVRLLESHEITSPFSVGLGEICLPTRLLDAMSDSEVEAVLAHELAHLERRDGLWFPAVAFVDAVLWMFPLTRWVSSRTRYFAELACDDRAVALTKEPRALAHALAYVAQRALASQRCALVSSMADSSSALLRRVKRLVGVDVAARNELAMGTSGWAIAGVVVTGCSLSAVSLDLPEGEPPLPRAIAPVAAAAMPSRRQPPRDRSALEQELADLELRERRVQAELDALLSESELSSSAAPSPRRLELEQELRHSHEMRAFLETGPGEPTTTSEQASR